MDCVLPDLEKELFIPTWLTTGSCFGGTAMPSTSTTYIAQPARSTHTNSHMPSSQPIADGDFRSLKAKQQWESYHNSFGGSKIQKKRTSAEIAIAKRRKIMGQLKGSLDSPPDICGEIKGVNDSSSRCDSNINTRIELNYVCPSNTISDQNYRVSLAIANGKTQFTCTCGHMQSIYDDSSNACSHVRATVIKIMADLVDKQTNSVNVDELSQMLSSILE